MKGYIVTNLFASYQVNKTMSLSLGVNNLFDTLGFTEVEGDGHAARAVAGRSMKVSLKAAF
jgi:outer membrane receptor protein involved in Fe transport